MACLITAAGLGLIRGVLGSLYAARGWPTDDPVNWSALLVVVVLLAGVGCALGLIISLGRAVEQRRR